jgi:tetratricopeptide (TPR) repeat protein
VRRAAIVAWRGYYDEAIQLYKEASYKLDSDEGIRADMERLERRKQSQIAKEAGDKYFRLNQLDAALEKYISALELDDTNEIALSNIA